jgi:hypothetical protein
MYKFDFKKVTLPERALGAHHGIGLFKNSFIFDLFDEVVQRLTTTGVLQWMCKYYKEYFFPLYEASPQGPEVLTVQGLMFGFVVWLIAVAISFLIFMIEMFNKTVKKFLELFILIELLMKLKEKVFN